jgi:hypothetical protein
VSALLPLVVAAGCAQAADDRALDEGSDEDRAVEILTATAMHLSEDVDSLHYTREEARCSAEGIVGSLGVSRLEDLGLGLASRTPPRLQEPPLTTEEADAVYVAITGCIDLEGQMTDALLVRGRLPEDAARCVVRRLIDEGLVRQQLLADAEHRPPPHQVDNALADAGDACGVSEVGMLPPG